MGGLCGGAKDPKRRGEGALPFTVVIERGNSPKTAEWEQQLRGFLVGSFPQAEAKTTVLTSCHPLFLRVSVRGAEVYNHERDGSFIISKDLYHRLARCL